MKKRIIITGGGGFVGRNLSILLSNEGYEVFSIMRGYPSHINADGSYIIIGDILNLQFLQDTISQINPQIIFHFAAQSLVGLSFTNPIPTLETNIIGTAHVLEVVKMAAPRCRIVFSSSSEVYGSQKELIFSHGNDGLYHYYLKEEQTVFPSTSPYSISKVCGEYLIDCYSRSYFIDSVIVRSFNIEGSGRGDSFATSTICRQAAELKKNMEKGFHIGNLAVFRDFTHVQDAVRAYYLIATQGTTGSVYNLGSRKITSLASFLLYATEAAGFQVTEIEFGDKRIITHPLNIETLQDSSKITRLDAFLLQEPSMVSPEYGDIILRTVNGEIIIHIDPERFRPAENMIMISNNQKLSDLGYSPSFSVYDIATEQVLYYVNKNTGYL
ncbi:GDP-mannose 4,6-dehydratase [Methanospirillum sp.]